MVATNFAPPDLIPCKTCAPAPDQRMQGNISGEHPTQSITGMTCRVVHPAPGKRCQREKNNQVGNHPQQGRPPPQLPRLCLAFPRRASPAATIIASAIVSTKTAAAA